MKYILAFIATSFVAVAQPASVITPLMVQRDSIGQYHCITFTWDDLRAPAQAINPAGGSVAPDDTYPADAALLGVDIHYQRCGSFSSATPGSGGQ